MEDTSMERRERKLISDSMKEAHYITLRTGLCKAFLASSVIGSNMVSTCETGTMGTVRVLEENKKHMNLISKCTHRLLTLFFRSYNKKPIVKPFIAYSR